MPKAKIPLIQALQMLRSVGAGLDVFAATCPRFVESIGGTAGLSSKCEMTAVGPVPRFTPEEFERAAAEYGEQMGWACSYGE